jgi:hypothetical protein
MGEFLKVMPKNRGAADIGPIALINQERNPPTLASMGITDNQSATAQKLAEIPGEEFAARIDCR